MKLISLFAHSPRLKNSLSKLAQFSFGFALLVLVTACQTLTPSFEEPSLSVTSIRVLPTSGFEQPFEIGLKLMNPNSKALELQGVSYQLTIEGHKLAQGATSDIPAVPAFGEANFKVKVSTNIIGGLKLLQDVINKPRESVSYELTAKLSLGWAFMPRLTLRESGVIGLSQQ